MPPIPIETRPASEGSAALNDLKSGGEARPGGAAPPLEQSRIGWNCGKGFLSEGMCDSLSGPQDVGAAMGWRQGQSYWEDLRPRVLAALDGGMAARSAAGVFGVSVSDIDKALIRRRRTGEVSASARRAHRPRKLTPEQEAALAAHIAAHPESTLAAANLAGGRARGAALERRDGVGGRSARGCRLTKAPARRRAGPSGCLDPAPDLAGGAALRRCRQARLYRRDRRQHQDDPALRPRAARPAPVGPESTLSVLASRGGFQNSRASRPATRIIHALRSSTRSIIGLSKSPRPASASRCCRKRSASANDAGISADGGPDRRAWACRPS
jgi:transposase